MSKEGRVQGTRGPREKSSVPYSTITRRERSRKLAQKRRDIYKQIMEDMTNVMPFPKDVGSQLDYNTRLRLTICFFRMKAMLRAEEEETAVPVCMESERQIVKKGPPKPVLFKPGMMQDLMSEALDGFLMVTQIDGTIVFLSESIHQHLGLFQTEHIGASIYDLVLEEDHDNVRSKLSEADDQSVRRRSKYGTTEVTFFCRMRCSRFKMANTVSKSSGFKLVHVSGTLKVARGEPYIACLVRPVSPSSILEIRMEGNVFVAHYSMEMSCIYFDGRLRHLLGYTKEDMIGKTPFTFHHHEDTEATLQCSRDVQTKGEGVSGYYRFLNRFGEYIWIQSRAVLEYDSHSGKPSYIVCTSFVVSKEDGTKDLLLRQAIASGQSNFIGETLSSENPLVLKEQADIKIVKDKVMTSSVKAMTSSVVSTPVSGLKCEPTLTGEERGTGSSPPVAVSAGPKSSSLLYSMLSAKPMTSSSEAHTYHGSVSSLNGTASPSTVSRQPNAPGQRSRSMNVDKEDSCAPDSTTTSPHNPCSVRQEEIASQFGRTLSGSDLGYYSESSGSLRGRLASSFTGYESETSSYVYESGADASPHNLYSPDHPQSVNSNYSDGTFHSPTSYVTSPESHNLQSPFHSPSSVHSRFSPTYTLPVDHCSSEDSSPPQDNFGIDGEYPINFCSSEEMEVDYAKAGSLSPDAAHCSSLVATCTTSVPHQGLTGGGTMPQFYPKSSPTRPQYSAPQPPITAHLILSQQVRVPQPTCPSGCQGAFSDLPQLTGEDLKMLDAFEQIREEDRFDQLLSQQAALNCRGTMMI